MITLDGDRFWYHIRSTWSHTRVWGCRNNEDELQLTSKGIKSSILTCMIPKLIAYSICPRGILCRGIINSMPSGHMMLNAFASRAMTFDLLACCNLYIAMGGAIDSADTLAEDVAAKICISIETTLPTLYSTMLTCEQGCNKFKNPWWKTVENNGNRIKELLQCFTGSRNLCSALSKPLYQPECAARNM